MNCKGGVVDCVDEVDTLLDFILSSNDDLLETEGGEFCVLGELLEILR